jgi:peptidoglycan/LPS O-acetylase OafA/YrhL
LIAQQPQAARKGLQVVWALGLVSVLAVILGLSLDEDGRNQWDTVHAWGGLAIVGALVTLAPAAGRSLGLAPQRAWQAAACGAAALVLFWVLFTLPSVGSNLSLLMTVGVAAGVIAAWVAPGREQQAGPQRQTW